MRVLVIEDDPDVTLLYRLALEQADHTVDAVTSGDEGVAQAAATLPDVVILDGVLPDADGLEVLASLKGATETRPIPVVMVSARVSGTDQQSALDAGAAAYVVKPFKPARLVEVVAEVTASASPTDAAGSGRDADDAGASAAFVHAVSHELRTPLTSILGFSSLLAERFKDTLPPEALEMAERIRSSAAKLERLLTDLLELDRIGRGALTAQRERVMVEEVIARCLERVALDGRELNVSVDEGLHAFVDGGQLGRIVESLVTHSVRTTPAEATIEVSAQRSQVGLLVMVEDDGPGVPEDFREEIFEPFARTTASAGSGTGIGLSLVARFAALHGGRAWVEERSGGGASFRVELGG